jgi:N6-L-threonylcarbamoyladenine synthase
MKILGIETSCDETAAAVVEDGTKILSNTVASQSDLHAEFGGVVPEVAARSHVEIMIPVVKKALSEAKITVNDLDAIAVTNGPGLLGSLLIGVLTARTLAETSHKPLYPINHVEAHVYGAFIGNNQPKFPALALIVSGGHTQLVLFSDHDKYDLLGQTLDDAAGEAFDKVAAILGLPYPGGPSISKAAEQGDPNSFKLPQPSLGRDSLDFSFSGLKTAVLRAAQTAAGKDFRTPSYEINALLSQKQKCDLAASFQKTVVDILVSRTSAAASKHQPRAVILAGGVAANKILRDSMQQKFNDKLLVPPFNLCTDNAAMIASLAYFRSKHTSPTPPSKVEADPILAT